MKLLQTRLIKVLLWLLLALVGYLGTILVEKNGITVPLIITVLVTIFGLVGAVVTLIRELGYCGGDF